MKECSTRYHSVKPSELKKKDRIHTAAGLFQVVRKDVSGSLTTITMKPVFDRSEEHAFLTVHKSVRFNINRPAKK